MKARGFIAVCVAAASIVATVAHPGGQQAPSSGNTVTVVGTVKLPDGSPIYRAEVMLSKMYMTSGREGVYVTFGPEGSRVGPRLSATTDRNGEFRMPDVPADQYRMIVMHPSLPPLAVGKRRPDDPGNPTYDIKGTIFRLDIVLSPGATITGRVTDERGRPLPDIRVLPLEAKFIDGEPVRYPGIATTVVPTDVLGEYRIAGLLPGRYYLSAVSKGTWPGRRPGETFAFPPTFYPGVPSAQAQAIDVQAGQIVEGVDFSLTGTPVTHVSGILRGPRGEPIVGSHTMLQQSEKGSAGSSGSVGRADSTLADAASRSRRRARRLLADGSHASIFVASPRRPRWHRITQRSGAARSEGRSFRGKHCRRQRRHAVTVTPWTTKHGPAPAPDRATRSFSLVDVAKHCSVNGLPPDQ
jgi:hypothetical protein